LEKGPTMHSRTKGELAPESGRASIKKEGDRESQKDLGEVMKGGGKGGNSQQREGGKL